jgi:DNA-binding IclR family transcriptional regulator
MKPVAPLSSFSYHDAVQAKRSKTINVVSKAAQVLKACQPSREGLSLGDIAERTKLPRSTVQRIVQSLIAEGFLTSDGTARSIALGPELLSMGALIAAEVIEQARPLLKQLSQETGETVDLARFNRDRMVFVGQVAGSHRLRAVSAVGDVFPLHCTANGKAVLALLPDGELHDQLRRPLTKYTPNTKTNPQELLSEILSVRKTGIAIDEEEHTLGICAVGAAIRDGSNQLYSISVPVPSVRFRSNHEMCAKALTATMVEFTALLKG